MKLNRLDYAGVGRFLGVTGLDGGLFDDLVGMYDPGAIEGEPEVIQELPEGLDEGMIGPIVAVIHGRIFAEYVQGFWQEDREVGYIPEEQYWEAIS